jgi:hypothetical protein
VARPVAGRAEFIHTLTAEITPVKVKNKKYQGMEPNCHIFSSFTYAFQQV